MKQNFNFKTTNNMRRKEYYIVKKVKLGKIKTGTVDLT